MRHTITLLIMVWGVLLFAEKDLLAENHREILELAANNLQVRAAKVKTEAFTKAYEAAKGANYPRLDLEYGATYLQDKPVMYVDSQMGRTAWQIGPQNHYEGSLTLSYPFFSGFAITAGIHKAKLESVKASLEEGDVKRNITLSVVSIYSQTVAVKEIISAKNEALHAAEESLKKAQGFYDQGLIPISQVYNIKAKAYEIDSDLIHTQYEKKMLLNQLSHLVDTTIYAVEGLPGYQPLELALLVDEALREREDIKAIQTALEIREEEITIAKSRNYPEVSLFAQARRTGDSLKIDGDDFTNKNKSSVGVLFSYNLFDGLNTKRNIEAAKRNAKMVEYLHNDYRNRIRTEITNSHLTFRSFQDELKAADKRLDAQEAFYELTMGRFENQLTSTDELSRAIADLAAAKAKYFALKAELYRYYSRLLLEVSLRKFESTLQ